MNQKKKVGILGGGQLGRMLVQKAIDFNIDLKIIDPDPNAPCKHIVENFVCGDLKDYETVIEFGKDLNVLSIEIEKVNAEALKDLEKSGVKVFPQGNVVELIQDKRKQKEFYSKNNIPSPEYRLINGKDEIIKHKDFFPCFYKLGKDGYDGRGVHSIQNESDIVNAFDGPGLLEKTVMMDKEISIIVARNSSGEISTFPAVEMVFHPEANLVDYLLSPADINEETSLKARKIAEDIILKIDMTGILAVEMFLNKDGQILVNEMAPRTHNSGHQSIESNHCSQFEQHLRSIMNWPLGNTDLIIPSAMINLLGEDGYTGDAIYEGLEEVLKIKGLHVHLYGKKLTKPFRKMGHITIADPNRESLIEKVKFVKDNFRIIA